MGSAKSELEGNNFFSNERKMTDGFLDFLKKSCFIRIRVRGIMQAAELKIEIEIPKFRGMS